MRKTYAGQEVDVSFDPEVCGFEQRGDGLAR